MTNKELVLVADYHNARVIDMLLDEMDPDENPLINPSDLKRAKSIVGRWYAVMNKAIRDANEG